MEAPEFTFTVSLDTPFMERLEEEITVDINDLPANIDAEGLVEYCEGVAEAWLEENVSVETDADENYEIDEFIEQLELYRKYKDLDESDLERMQELGMVG